MFNTHIPNSDTRMFLDPNGPVGIARYDIVKYPVFTKLTKQQTGYFWQPTEVDCSKDAKDFRKLTENEQHIFTSNLKRQIVLDSIQGRAPSAILAPICSLPEVENWIQTWNYFETIHSLSYTHIIQNVYADPSSVLDEILTINPILDCAKSISEPYDALERFNKDNDPRHAYYHKKALWLALNSVNALEGIRFYVSFVCSWAFAEANKMEGNATIIKLIARDEAIHLAATQHMIKLLPADDPNFIKIREECAEEVRQMFIDVVEQEVAWAEYLFKDGSMIGLNTELLTRFVHYIANKRMTNIGIDTPYEGGTHPLPWINKWTGGSDVQKANQETQNTMYIVGTKRNANPDQFKGFQL